MSEELVIEGVSGTGQNQEVDSGRWYKHLRAMLQF